MCKESNEDETNETLQTNEQKALTSLQSVYSCAFTCFRFASTLNMLLCLSFCFVSLIQSSSVFPRFHFSPVCEFLVIPCDCSHCENGSFEVLSLHLSLCIWIWEDCRCVWVRRRLTNTQSRRRPLPSSNLRVRCGTKLRCVCLFGILPTLNRSGSGCENHLEFRTCSRSICQLCLHQISDDLLLEDGCFWVSGEMCSADVVVSQL